MSPIPSGGVALAAPHPYVRPEHRSAALLPPAPASAAPGDGSVGSASSGGGTAAAPQLVAAEGRSGPAAWLLDGSLQHLLELPRVDEGRPVSLWWRVTAGGCGADQSSG